MTPQTPAEQQKWALILSTPSGAFRSTHYHYPSEAAARADITKLLARPDFKHCSVQRVVLESEIGPLLSEREEQA